MVLHNRTHGASNVTDLPAPEGPAVSPETDTDTDADRDADREAPLENASHIDAVLGEYQLLQMRNSHVSATVASALGIGASDLRALLFISSSEEVTPKQVGSFLELTSGAVTNLIDRMDTAGLVHRVSNPNDRRSVVLELAPEGLNRLF